MPNANERRRPADRGQGVIGNGSDRAVLLMDHHCRRRLQVMGIADQVAQVRVLVQVTGVG